MIINDKTGHKIYGFEDYKFLNMPEGMINAPTARGFYLPHEDVAGLSVPNQNLAAKCAEILDCVEFTPNIENHKELVGKGKKVYVHSCCELPRAMIATKYKKCLDPYKADIVVIPTPNLSALCLTKALVFINEEHKIAVKIVVRDPENVKKANSLEMGTSLWKAITADSTMYLYDRDNITDSAILASELVYFGEMLSIPNNVSYIFDLLTWKIPFAKTVYEETIQETLGDESNKIDLPTLLNIKEMLSSNDSETIAVGLKALSVLDYCHYPNSVKYAMGRRSNWINSNAVSASSVKYMLKNLFGTTYKRRILTHYDTSIYKQDYLLFRDLCAAKHCTTDPQMIDSIMEYYNFVKTTEDGTLVPVLRQ